MSHVSHKSVAPRASSSPIENYYDEWGWVYPAVWGETIHWGLFKTGRESLSDATRAWSQRTIELLQGSRGDRVLDVGCGPAMTTHRMIEQAGTFVDGIDVSEFQLARARTANAAYIADGRLRLSKGDVAQATLPSKRYDCAFSEAVFFHLLQKRRSLENIRSALRVDARFVFDDLIVTKPCDLDEAFGRFGKLDWYSEGQHVEVLRETRFKLLDTIAATDDIARTYLELLNCLEERKCQSEPRFSPSTYAMLERSFRAIAELLDGGTLTASVFVVKAI